MILHRIDHFQAYPVQLHEKLNKTDGNIEKGVA